MRECQSLNCFHLQVIGQMLRKQCLDSYEKLSEICGRPLVDMDTCTLHIVHNGNGAGFKAYGSQTKELALGLHAFLKGLTAREEDLQSIQQTLHVEQYVFLWYVSTRWVTLAKVLQRIIQQMPVVVEV